MRLPFGTAPDAHASSELLSAYLDNQVAGAERTRLEQHLRECGNCRAELSSLRQTVALLQALPRVPVPRAFTLSEAQVGARGRVAGTPWYWGLARGLGAVAAMAVIAVLAVALFQRGAAPGASQVARFAPTVAPAAAPAIAPQPQAATEPSTSAPAAQNQGPAAEKSAQPGAGPATADQQAPAAPPPAAAAKLPTVTAAAPQALSAPAAAPAAPAATSAAAAATQPAAPTESAGSLAAGAAAAGSPEPYSRQLGLGGGGGAATSPLASPQPLPPAAPLASRLQPTTGVAYSDPQGLTAIDAQGERALVQTANIGTVQIAPDRSWVAYWVQHDNGSQVWAVRWDGSNAHAVFDPAAFKGRDGSAPGSYQINDMRWIPGTHSLALTLSQVANQKPEAPIVELWSVNVDTGSTHYVLDLHNATFAYSPNGANVAVMQHGEPGQAASLAIYAADGSNARVALNYTLNANGYGMPGQLAWWPDSSGLWVAVADASADFAQAPGITLYRVPLNGKAKAAGHIAGLDTFWSPDGQRLAYTQPAGSPENRQLVLANADGSNAQVYATIQTGGFIDWSADSQHFLYSSQETFAVGLPGKNPVNLGQMGSIIDPRWSGSQVLYLQDQDGEWELVSYTADGRPASLLAVPKGITMDVTR